MNKIKTRVTESSDERLTNHLENLMDNGIEVTPYVIVKAKLKLGITQSGKELSEMASYFTQCVDEHRSNNER